jgi:Ca2+-binding RTX toxin-like protein
VLVGQFSTVETIILYGGDGDDTLIIDADITNDSQMYGDDGHDTIKGGGGNDVMFGGAGDDKLKARGANDILVGSGGADLLAGGPGRDVVIGGDDIDRITGDADDDILISGSSSHDGDITALRAIQAEWLSTDPYATRVANLRNGGGLNGPDILDADVTVFGDGVRDVLTGSNGSDWFLINAGGVTDKITDVNATEFADVLSFILEP